MREIGVDLLDSFENNSHEKLKIYAFNLLKKIGCMSIFEEYGIPMIAAENGSMFEQLCSVYIKM